MPLIKSVQDQKKKKAVSQPVQTQQTRIVPKTPDTTRITGADRTRRNSLSSRTPAYTRRFGLSTQLNYQTRQHDQWSAPEMAAYGRKTGDQRVFDLLSQSSGTRGTKYWNPYRGGQAVLPEGCADFFRSNFGYEGPFDQKFCDDMNAMYGSDVRFTNGTTNIAKPTKKSSMEEWAGWYVTQLQDKRLDNDELNQQWGEARKAYNDFYDQFEKVNGRAPTFDEFSGAVDLGKYSKINTINQSLQYGTALQFLPNGTFYSPDVITGLYHAKRNGQDINVDRDYFEDAVQYAMSPVESAPSMQKYEWSGSDLSQMGEADRDSYIALLNSQGKYQEAADFQYAHWAAQPHPEGMSVEMQPLDARYGSHHDKIWRERVEADLGDDIRAYYKADGTMDKPKDSDGPLAKAAYYFYQATKNSEKTEAIDDEYMGLCSSLQNYRDNYLSGYSADGYEEYRRDVLNRVFDVDVADWDSEQFKSQESFSDDLNDWLKNGYNPSKHSYDTHISKQGIEAMIRASWNGEDVTQKKDWAAQVDSSYEPDYGSDAPDEPPLFYNENQRQAADQRIADRNNAERQVTDAVEQLAESGAQMSKGAIPVTNATMEGHLSPFGKFSGWLAKLWHDAFGSKHSEKLGADYTPAEAAAVDPVLAQLDVQDMPDDLTTDDIYALATAKVMSGVNDDDICMADGIINYALPGVKHLQSALLDRVNDLANFNVLTYRNVYNGRVDAGVSEDEAAEIALFAATNVNTAVGNIGARYEGDDKLSGAAQRLISNIALEDGSQDSYTLFKTISDDVHATLSDDSNKAKAVMDKLLPGLVLGSSGAATPGFRAETNRITHDIATGVITPQDIVDGLDDTPRFTKYTDEQNLSDAAKKHLDAGGEWKDLFVFHDTYFTREEYNNGLKEAKSMLEDQGGLLGLFRSDGDYLNISDDLKQLIDYDGIVGFVQGAFPDDAPLEQQYRIAQATRSAVEELANPDKVWHTNPLMQNTTPLLDELNSITSSKSDEDVQRNLDKIEQQSSDVRLANGTKFVSYIADFLTPLAPDFFKKSDAAMLVSDLREYGKMFSVGEVSSLLSAFDSGKLSYAEAKGLIDNRIQALGGPEIGSRIANATNNPQALDKTYEKLDAGLERAHVGLDRGDTPENIARRLANGEPVSILNEYPGMSDAVDTEWLSSYLKFNDSFSEEEIVQTLADELSKYDFEGNAQQKFSPEQLDNIDRFIDLYKSWGANGIVLTVMDPSNLKELCGIDLEGTGFNDGSELLSYLDKDWSTPYGLNPGYTHGMLEAVVEGAGEGVGAVLSIPSKVNFFLHDFSYGLVGQEYDPENSNSIYDRAFGLNKSYNAFQEDERRTASMQQNVATGGQAFVEQGVSEFIRNSLSSTISGIVGGKYATGMAERMTGLPDLTMANLPAAGMADRFLAEGVTPIAQITSAGEALDLATTAINRSLFSISVFANDYNKNRTQDKKSVWNSLIRSTLSAAIELATESPVYEKFNNLAIGGFVNPAKHYAETAGFGALSYAADFAKNVLFEISEEEASELLGRLVDVGEGVITGNDLKESWDKAFEGYGEAAKNTAIATAFTTVLFGVADMGGMFADYMRSSMANGTKMDVETAMRYAKVDAILNAPSAEEIARRERTGALDYAKAGEQASEPVQAEEAAAETAPAYNPATDLPYFRKNGEANEPHAASPSKAETARKELDEAVKNYAREAAKKAAPVEAVTSAGDSAENTEVSAPEVEENAVAEEDQSDALKSLSDDIVKKTAALATAMEEDRAEAAQKAQEAASGQTEENPQAQAEEGQETAPELTEGAQRVKDYVAHSEAAMDNAVIESGAQAAAEQAVAEDAGIRAKEQAIEKMQSKIQEMEEQIAGKQQEAQTITNQLRQAFYAAVDEGFDMNSPQAVNVQFQKTQQKAAVEAEAAAMSEKQSSLTREIEEAQKQLEEDKQKAAAEAKEQSTADLTKELEERRKQMAEDAERELNANLAREGGYNVHSMATTEEDARNRAAIASEQEAKIGLYSDVIGESSGTFATERFTDPANYRRKSNYTERRSEEWRDESKHRQDAIDSDVEAERNKRLRDSFWSGLEKNGYARFLQVDKSIYDLVTRSASKEAGTSDYSRYAKYVPAKGESAIPYSQSRVSGNGNRNRTVTRDDAGYSENAEDVGVYSAADFLNDDGTVTGLSFRAIVAADPDFADNPVLLRTNSSNGGVDAVLEHFSENNHWLLLATPYQKHEYGKASLEEDKYHMLTKDHGLDYMRNARDNAQKRVDDCLSRMRQAHTEIEQLKPALDDPMDHNPSETARKFKEANEKLERASRGFKAAQHEFSQADNDVVQAEAFVRDYKYLAKKTGKTIYVIDKAAIEDAKTQTEIYRDAMVKTADRISENAFLSDEGIIELLKHDAADGNKDAEDLVEERLRRMSHEELGAALFDHFMQEELQKGYAEQYKGAVQVLRGTDNMTADKQAADFIKSHGGYAADGFGGQGFAKFSKPDYYDKSKAYMVSEEAVLKFVPENMWKGLIVEAKGERADFDKTAAQYDVEIRNYARRFAESNGLSDSDAARLSDEFSTRGQAPRTIGNATVVDENGELYFGVPAKSVDDYTKNSYIRDEDGSYSADLAVERLENKLREMIQTSEDEANGIPGKKLNTNDNYIGVWFVEEDGTVRKNVKVGEYYSWWNGGSRFFPSLDQMLSMADKIVCNFPAKQGKNNRDSLVSFTLAPKKGDMVDLEREMNDFDAEGAESELAYMRGVKTAREEFEKAQAQLDGITEDSDLRTSASLKSAHAKFNYAQSLLREALDKAETCTEDRRGYWRDRAITLMGKVDDFGKEIRSINEKAAASSRNDATGYQSAVPRVELKQLENQLAEARKQTRTANGDARIAEIEARIKELQPLVEADERTIQEIQEQEDRRERRRRYRAAIPKTAEGRYNKAKARYDLLTDPNGRYFGDRNYDHEREMFAAVLPNLKQFADEELAAKEAEAVSEQPASIAHPDPTARQIAEALTAKEDVDNVAKLVILKNLSDAGGDVADLRSKAIDDFHNKQMEGMSDDEKIDYVAALARQQKMNPNGYTIDPNTNYDAQLGEMLKAKVDKDKSKEARRIKAIGRTTYKTPRGANNALAELDALEKKGHDVTEARERIQRNLKEIDSPYQARKDAIVEAADTPDMKMNLHLFSAESQSEAVDNIMDTMPAVITEQDEAADAMLEKMADTSSQDNASAIDTGFNQMVDNVRTADSYMTKADQVRERERHLSDLVARVEDLNDEINSKAAKSRELKGEQESINKRLGEIAKETKMSFVDSRASTQYEELAVKIDAILTQAESIEAEVRQEGTSQKNTDLLEGLANDLEETRNRMVALEQAVGSTWTDEQRREYGQLLNRASVLPGEIAEVDTRKGAAVEERNAAKEERDTLSDVLLNNKLAQTMAHNDATFNMLGYIGTEDEIDAQIRRRRLGNATKSAQTLLSNMEKSGKRIHAQESTFTVDNLAEMLADGVIDEMQLSRNKDVANALNSALKGQKKALALLEYAIQYGDYKAGKIDEDSLDAARKKAHDAIFALTKLHGYGTQADYERETNAHRNAEQAINEYQDYLDRNVFVASMDTAMNALTYQHRILSNNIEQAEQAVHDRFGLSTVDDIRKALDGSNGGRLPQPIMDVLVGAVYQSQFSNKGKRKNNFDMHVLSRNLRSFREYVANTCGKWAPIINSIIVDPVLRGEGAARDWKAKMKSMIDSVGLKTDEQWEAMGHILDSDMPDDYIRENYKEDADALITAKPVLQQVLQMAIEDQNPVLSRNGQELIKWHANYFPHQQEEQSRFFKFLGINATANDLPTGLLGATEGTAPNKQFASHTLHRSGEDTEGINWNAKQVLDRYLDSAAAIIFQGDNLARMNDFIKQLGGNRSKTGNKDIDYAAVSPLDYSSVGELSKRSSGSLFVKALETFRDQVAGKKTGQLDRMVENQFKRTAISALQGLTKMQGVAKVGLNMKTVALNAVPVVTSTSMHPFRSIQAAYSVIDWRLQGNDLLEHPELKRSNFFKARCGDDRNATSRFDKATNWMFVPMEASDRISTAITWLGNYYNCLDQLGGEGNEKQAAQSADVMTSSMMGSKLRGDKGEAYNSTVGSALLQFTQEAVNQVGFLFKDMHRYQGGGRKALAKYLASLLSIFAAGFLGNKLVGSDSTIDPISVSVDAINDFKNGKKASDAIGSAITRFIDQLNPVDNITSGNIFEAPAISSVQDILKALRGGGDAVLSAIFDQDNDDEDNDSKWIGDLARAAWGWVPGSTQIKRMWDTGEAAIKGYAPSTSGKIKFGYDPSVGNVVQSALFGVNATKEGREYVKSGYKNVEKARAEGALDIANTLGISFSDGLDIYDKQREVKDAESAAKELGRWDEDNAVKADEAKQLRSEIPVPDGLSQAAKDSINDPAVQKGIQMYQDTGLVTYPTEYTIHEDAERGLYIMRDGKNYSVDQETVDRMNQRLMDDYRYIVENNDDPDTVAKLVKKQKERIIKEYIKGGE